MSDKSQKLLAKAYHDNAPHVRVITLIKEKERQRKAEDEYINYSSATLKIHIDRFCGL